MGDSLRNLFICKSTKGSTFLPQSNKEKPPVIPSFDEIDRMEKSLDTLVPAAANAGTRMVAENMPFGFLPRADQIPNMSFSSHPVPATTNPLGVKGCGEAGVTGALPAVMNALTDALAKAGASHVDMPATPERVLAALGRV